MFISPQLRRVQPCHVQPVTLNDHNLTVVDRLTLLGVILTNELSWSVQALHVQRKMNSRLGVLKRFSSSMNFRTRLQLFNAFILPLLTYCLPVWGHCALAQQHAFDHTLTRCARYVFNDEHVHLSRHVFMDSNICKFSDYVLMNDVFTVFKYIHLPNLDDFSIITTLNSVSQRSSRAAESNKIVVPNFNRKMDDLCFLSTGLNAWNSLPNCLTSCSSLAIFKHRFTKYLLDLLQ
jgi:hypothetical protein